MGEAILRARDLQTHFFTDKGVARVLDGVTFNIKHGEILGLVGESGSGKSLTGFSLINLIKKPGKLVGGKAWLQDSELLSNKQKLVEKIRGKKISMIFQNPKNSLNPLITIGDLLIEVLQTHHKLSKKEAYSRSIKLLEDVYIPAPKERMKAYPHELSGGMAQRIMIALAISCNPKLLIADEPTTGLDVTTQSQILKLLRELNSLNHSSQLFITHDLGVASEHCDRIAVMYAGTIVEENTAKNILKKPLHPYTRGLVASRPTKDSNKSLVSMPGTVPDPHFPPTGCRFHPRCPWATEICKEEKPIPESVESGSISCWNWKEAQYESVDRFGS